TGGDRVVGAEGHPCAGDRGRMLEVVRSAGGRTGADADAVARAAPDRVAPGAGHDRVVDGEQLRAAGAECVDRRVGGRPREVDQIAAAAALRDEPEARAPAEERVAPAGNARAEDAVRSARAELDRHLP